MKDKSKFSKRHKYGVGDVVTFRFIGVKKTGTIMELTKGNNGWATYKIKGDDKTIYPGTGVGNENEFCNIIV